MTNRTDNFNRADSTTDLGTPSDGGSAWEIPVGGTWGIVGNAAYKVSAPVSYQVALLESSVTAVEVQATVTVVGTGGGLVARASDDYNHISLNWGGTDCAIYKRVASTWTQLGSIYSGTLTAGDVLKLSCDAADLLSIYQNGNLRVSATDAALNTLTKHGLETYGEGTANSFRWDDFSITAIVATAAAGGIVVPLWHPPVGMRTGRGGLLMRRFAPPRVFGDPGLLATIAGTVAITAGNDTSAATGSPTVTGTVVKTAGNDTANSNGAGTITGSLAWTGANDTSAASGKPTVIGTVAKTAGNDTANSNGSGTIVGTLARTGANDTSAASGKPTVTGTLARTGGADTANSNGSGTITGTLARTGAADTSAASGSPVISGSLARTGGNDTANSNGSGAITGTLARTGADDTSAAAGSLGTTPVPPVGVDGGTYAQKPDRRKATRKERQAETARLARLAIKRPAAEVLRAGNASTTPGGGARADAVSAQVLRAELATRAVLLERQAQEQAALYAEMAAAVQASVEQAAAERAALELALAQAALRLADDDTRLRLLLLEA